MGLGICRDWCYSGPHADVGRLESLDSKAPYQNRGGANMPWVLRGSAPCVPEGSRSRLTRISAMPFLLSLCGMPWFLLSLVVCVNGTMAYHTTHLESACVPQHSQLAAYRGISGTWKDHDIINIQLTRSRPSQSLEKTATPAPGKQYSYLYTRRLIRRFHPPGNLTQNYNTPKQSRVL
jgi:hypothetical protein